MPREWSKKPTRERRRLAAEAVLNLLPVNGSEHGWTELRLKAEEEDMSSATLRSHLKRFVEESLVVRRMDPATYPPRVYYRRNVPHLFPMETYRFYLASEELGDVEEEVVDLGLSELAADLGDMAVGSHVRMLNAYVVALLRGSLGGRGPYTFKPGEIAEPGAIEEYVERLHEDQHDLLDELLDLVLRPWLHRLLDVARVTPDEAETVLERLGEEATGRALEALDGLTLFREQAREEIAERAKEASGP